eukprot:m.258482 g.258482  ORF g.258482 m.258482 type:complete len:181 (+) comp54577_c1_seq34:772-1314(+)
MSQLTTTKSITNCQSKTPNRLSIPNSLPESPQSNMIDSNTTHNTTNSCNTSSSDNNFYNSNTTNSCCSTMSNNNKFYNYCNSNNSAPCSNSRNNSASCSNSNNSANSSPVSGVDPPHGGLVQVLLRWKLRVLSPARPPTLYSLQTFRQPASSCDGLKSKDALPLPVCCMSASTLEGRRKT